MKKSILIILFSCYSMAGHSTVWTILSPNSSSAFNPDSITIFLGDTVRFFLGNLHNSVEVAKGNWDTVSYTSGVVPLAGGFSLSFSGGYVYPPKLGAGVHYYVCTPHVNVGMKGRIFVVDPSIIVDPSYSYLAGIFPNPAFGNINISYNIKQKGRVEVKIVEMTGQVCAVLLSEIKEAGSYNQAFELDRTRFSKGIYMIILNAGDLSSVQKIFIE